MSVSSNLEFSSCSSTIVPHHVFNQPTATALNKESLTRAQGRSEFKVLSLLYVVTNLYDAAHFDQV